MVLGAGQGRYGAVKNIYLSVYLSFLTAMTGLISGVRVTVGFLTLCPLESPNEHAILYPDLYLGFSRFSVV